MWAVLSKTTFFHGFFRENSLTNYMVGLHYEKKQNDTLILRLVFAGFIIKN